MACTGIEFCKLAIVETKAAAAELITELEKRLSDLEVDISVNVNGCPNACARTQVADIGLKGQLVPGPDGEMVPGFQVHLGGALTLAADQSAGFGRKLRGLKTTSADLVDYVARLARNYAAARAEGESFATWVIRAPEEELR
jgi:sulfite reductase (ferredoxin)